MIKNKTKIFMLVEGKRIDVTLMNHLLDVYGLDDKHEIVSYNTNIYTLYNEMFKEKDPMVFDLLQLLKEKEQNEENKKIFDDKYTDIILVFDFDPQDPLYKKEKIIDMQVFFTESSDMGKLYLNYPMIEAFYHMKEIPDLAYNGYTVFLDELIQKKYKQRVNSLTKNGDYRKFAENKQQCDIVFRQNYEKAKLISNSSGDISLTNVLRKQAELLEKNMYLYVLCTCVFYIYDYNSQLIDYIDVNEEQKIS